jgi:glycine cleavage system H lipoate-binding protein
MGETKLEGKSAVGSESKLPKEGEFDQGRFWYSRRGSVLTLGLTSYGIESLGDLEEITFPDEGEHLGEGDEIVTVEGTRGTLELVLPTKGLVLEVNPIASDLSLIAEDPVENGWLLRYQIDDLEALSRL